MGLFILPGRLKNELHEIAEWLMGGKGLPETSPHYEWAREMLSERKSASW